MTPPAASVLIPTRNRRAMLLDTIASVLAQTVAVEVIAVDDGSTDGTTAAVAERFPPGRFPVRVIRHERSAGPTRRRNEAADAATADVLFTIDDDCLVPSPHTFAQTLAGFDRPRVGAVTIPFVNVHQGERVYYAAPADGPPLVSFMFYGGMVAFRRSAFRAVGGYRSYYFMHVEEPDLSIRLLDAGYVVRVGSADPIHHLESPVRNRPKLHVLGPRNHLLYHWYNTPAPAVFVRLPVTAAATLAKTVQLRRPDLGLWGLARGVAAAAHEFNRRDPVRRSTHALARRLRAGPLPLSEVEPLLPPLVDRTTTEARRHGAT